MAFYPGQHVVCVYDASDLDAFSKLIAKGRVYTVRDTLSVWSVRRSRVPAVRLVEVTLPIHQKIGAEHVFAAARFRPLDEKRLDVLRAHLEPTPAKEVA